MTAKSGVILCFLCFLIFSLAEGSSARAITDHENTPTIIINSFENGDISFTIDSTGLYDNVLLCTAVYLDNRLADIKMTSEEISIGTVTIEQSFSRECNYCKVIMIDAETYVPVAASERRNDPAYLNTVAFVDDEGTVLSSQKIASGASATLPDSPKKEGFIFAGWEGNYKNVTGNETVVATYVSDTAPNIFDLSSACGEIGETITLTLRLTGTVNVCAFDMRLNYDGNVLEFVNFDEALSLDVVANHVEGQDQIVFNFSSTSNRTSDANILNITFRIKDVGDSDTTISLLPVEVVYADEDNAGVPSTAEYSLTEGLVFIR